MQKLDEQKRQKILQCAAEMFATKPFHKVLLSDVAEVAEVGKGTLYTYFKNKEELYLAVLYSGFEKLVDQLRQKLEVDESRSPCEALEAVVYECVHYAYQNPHLFDLIRSAPAHTTAAQWDQKRRELTELVESVIRRGIRLGQFTDPHPELTARFVPGLVRAALLEGTAGKDPRLITRHILRFLSASLLVDSVHDAAAGD
jgi:AcrR family transcriptional regulator